MRIFATLCYILVITAVSGCSNQQVYEGLQMRNRNDCEKLEQSDRAKCLEAANKRYEDYKRDREQATKN